MAAQIIAEEVLANDQLKLLFSPDSWELRSPKIFDTPQGKLLFEHYRPRDGDRLEIKPCTLIFQPRGRGSGKDAVKGRTVVMQAPEGAVLRFDAETNLARGKVGQLIGGILAGPITIRSPRTSADADDDLELKTRNVQITPQQIITPHEVHFRYGMNRGSGRDLIIALRPARHGETGPLNGGPAFGELDSIELVHLASLELHLDQGSKLQGVGKPDNSPPGKVAVKITCDGPFKFDFVDQTASFRDRVHVHRISPQTPTDDLRCELLNVRFAQRDTPPGEPQTGAKRPNGAGQPAASNASSLASLRVQAIRAMGSPAILNAPTYGANVIAELLEYDFDTREARIEDSDRIRLRFQQNEVQAKSVHYQLAEQPHRIGQGRMEGPGWVKGFLGGDPQKAFYVAWSDRLIVQPHQGQHAVSLIAGAEVRMAGMGQVQANNLHVWLREVLPSAGKKNSDQPSYAVDRMLAEQNVHFDSPQLTGAVQRAEVWLRDDTPPSRSTVREVGGSRPAAGPRAQNVPVQVASHPVASPPPATATGREIALAAASMPIRRLPPPAAPPAQKFDLQGQQIQVQLVQNTNEISVEHLIVDGGVQFREIRTAKRDEIPLSIAADFLQIRDANSPAAKVQVQGSPAEVAARGMVTSGDRIQLYRGENRLWIDGPGKMTLPPKSPVSPARSPESGLLASQPAGPVTISWAEGMDFNGLTARFTRDVRVRGRQMSSRGEVYDMLILGQELAVSLEKRLDFSEDDHHADAKVRTLAFTGEVYLQNVSLLRGEQTSFDQMHVRDLQLDQGTGRLHALGPGWGASVRHDNGLQRQAASAPRPAGPAQPPALVFVRVDFEDEAMGNMQQREIEFRGRVHTVYGPVDSWDQTLPPDPVGELAEGQYLLTSERLSLVDMSEHMPGVPSAIELAATGNATIESRDFTARGWRVSYARDKEMVVLEGDGRNDAELWLTGSTTRDAAAQEVRFWTNDKSIQVDGGRFLDLSQLGSITGS